MRDRLSASRRRARKCGVRRLQLVSRQTGTNARVFKYKGMSSAKTFDQILTDVDTSQLADQVDLSPLADCVPLFSEALNSANGFH